MTSQVIKCPTCLSVETKLAKTSANYPAIIFPVDEKLVDSIDVKTLEIYHCNTCGHLFQRNVDLQFNEKIYTEYYKFYPYNDEEHFVEHYRLPFERVFSSISLDKKEKTLLEIGVSSGDQLNLFENQGFDSKGITPQKIEDSKIISSFYEDYEFKTEFDVIVSRFNMEHIIDLDVFMSKINKDLTEGGLVVAQIPNVEYFMSENILNFYAHEHIHYFTRKSLFALFERHGFIVESMYDYKSPSIVVVGRKIIATKVTFNEYVQNSSETANDIMSLFDGGERVVLYGASLSLSELIYNRGLKEKGQFDTVIIDDNPIVRNMLMPLYGKKIVPYGKNVIENGDIIILTLNSIYHDVIVKKLRSDGHQNKIYSICSSGLQELQE